MIKLETLVKEEGKGARNLLSWRVPHSPARDLTVSEQEVSSKRIKASRSPSKRQDIIKEVGEQASTSISEKLWSYLFRNVNQAVDELYYLCESENSLNHCKEVENLLSNYNNKFTKLTVRIQDQLKSKAAWEGEKTCTVAPLSAPNNASLQQVGMYQTGKKSKKQSESSYKLRSLNGVLKVSASTSEKANTYSILENQKDPIYHTVTPQEIHSSDLQPAESSLKSCSFNRALKVDTSTSRKVNGNSVIENQKDSKYQTTTPQEMQCNFPAVKLQDLENQNESTNLTVEVLSTEAVERSLTQPVSSSNPSCTSSSGNKFVDEGESMEGTASSMASSSFNSEDDYAQATEQIWAEAEAWVDAAAQEEEDAWLELSNCSSSSCIDSIDEQGQMDEQGNSCEISNQEAPPENADDCVPSHLELHRKLLSPGRKRPTPAEAKQRYDLRHQAAQQNREQLTFGLLDKLRARSAYADQVKIRQRQRLAHAQEVIRKRMDGAGARREAYLNGVIRKANDENCKVHEVLFMNKLTVEDLKITIEMRLREVEQKIMGGRMRRQHHLIGIEARQRSRAREKAASISEHQSGLDKTAAARWELLQARLESVQCRREERLAEVQRRSEATEKAQREAKDRRNAMLNEVIARAAAKKARREEALAAEVANSNRKKAVQGENATLTRLESDSMASTLEGTGALKNKSPEEGMVPSKGAKKRARRARGHLKRCAGSMWDESWAGKDVEQVLKAASDSSRQRMNRFERLISVDSDNMEQVLNDLLQLMKGGNTNSNIDLHLARTSGVLDCLHTLFVPPRKTQTPSHPPPTQRSIYLAAACLSASFAVPANVLHALRSHNGGAHIVNCLAWALVQRCEPFKNSEKGKNGTFLSTFFSQYAALLLDPCSACLIQILAFDIGASITVDRKEIESVQSALVRYFFARGLISGLYNALCMMHSKSTLLAKDNAALTAVTSLFGVLEATAKFSSKGSHKFDTVSDELLYSVQIASTRAPVALEQAVVAGLNFSPPITLLSALLLGDPSGCHGPNDVCMCSQEVLGLAISSLRCIHSVALLNLSSVQGILASETVRPEFLTICDVLLNVTHSRLMDSSAGSLEVECLTQLLQVLGAFVLNSQQNQDMLLWGAPPCLLTRLCRLPYSYFAQEERHILLPTLVCACFENKRARDVLSEEVSVIILQNYIQFVITTDPRSTEKLDLAQRFPPNLWLKAIEFFS